MTDKFKVGDLVFAKVRGYPSWPARVKNTLIDVNPKNSRYEVFFFGTYETALCRPEEICSYVDNKEKLGKGQKRKNFKDALWEIEHTPDTDGPQKLPESLDLQRDPVVEDDARSEASTSSLKIVEGTAKVPRRQSLMKKRESVDMTDDEPPAKKKPKKSDIPESTGALKLSPSTPAAPEPERVSRSGRKIKPKRFLDEDDGQEEEKERKSISEDILKKIAKAGEEPKKVATVAPIEPDKSGKRSARISSTDTKKAADKSPMPSKPVAKSVGKVKDTEEFVPPTATVSPIVAPAASAKKTTQENKRMKVTFTQQQAKTMLDSDKTPDKVKEMLNKEMQAKLQEKEEIMKSKKAEKRRSKLFFLKIEVRLLQIDTVIKTNLSLDKAETKPVLQVLDELKNLKLSPIMLKKHPDIVFTIKKLKKYVGNVKNWNQSEEEKDEFAKKAGEIRQKATQIFEYFKLVLLGSKDVTDVSSKFMKQIEELKEKTKEFTPTKFAALTKDPCAPANNKPEESLPENKEVAQSNEKAEKQEDKVASASEEAVNEKEEVDGSGKEKEGEPAMKVDKSSEEKDDSKCDTKESAKD